MGKQVKGMEKKWGEKGVKELKRKNEGELKNIEGDERVNGGYKGEKSWEQHRYGRVERSRKEVKGSYKGMNGYGRGRRMNSEGRN